LAAIQKITSPEGLGMSSERITVSTAGIAKMIEKLADDKVKFRLALSLHAANDDKRNSIMPINESNSLASLIDALHYFHQNTRNRITFEYIAFKDFNDSIADAKELLAICKKVPAKVNIIEYNPTGDGLFEKANANKIDAFAQFLLKNGVQATVRRSRGKDIDAACGQLANKKHENALIK
jgi:23S rRNA (adenine2503-C2)-methyltransferase